MIAPSTRHVPLILGLAVLLLVPMIRSRFEARQDDDCARPRQLLALARPQGSTAPVERYERYDEDLVQWTEMTLVATPQKGLDLRAALIRSFHAIDLYTRPPAKILGKLEAGVRRVEWVEVDGELIPIQTIQDSANGRNSQASWLFVYQGEAVEHPLWHQLSSAPAQVWGGTRPLSLLLVAGAVAPERREDARVIAQRWLIDAYRLHRDACRPEADAS